MREHTFKRWLLACSLALAAPVASHAAGLGRLTVLSGLGQPLNAEVELLSVQKGETLTARLSSVDTYQRANLPYNAALVGARVAVERRANGTPYIKVTTPRPVNEPFAELLIEINSENGRVTRQYTVLLDPPGYGRAAGELPPPQAPIAAPTARAPSGAAAETAPGAGASAAAPATAAPGAPGEGASGRAAAAYAPPPARRRAAPVSTGVENAAAGARTYGPVKRGETLGRIARSVQPEGVSLEQTLVGLYRHNPDAFIRKNMNLVKSGRILKVPEATELAAVGQQEAVKEVRLQVADFNSFRSRLAERAGAAPEEGSVASGRIGAAVGKGDAAEPRDTVRLSRGDKGAKGGAAERVRALEEEAVAREKALADANTRIEQLEKTIENMKRLAEMKGVPPPAAAPQATAKAQTPGPVAVAPVMPPPAKGPEATIAPGAQPGAAKGAGTTKDASAPGEPAKAAPDVTKGPAEAAKAPPTEAKSDVPAKPKAKAPPPPVAAEPDFIDTLMDEPLYLVAGAGVIVLGALGVVAVRRRRAEAGTGNDRVAPTLGPTEPGERPGRRGPAPAVAPVTTEPQEPAMPSAAAAEKPAPKAASSAADDNDLDFNADTGGAAPARGERPVRPRPAAAVEPPKAAEPPRAEYRPAAPAPRVEPARAPETPKSPTATPDELTRMPEPAARPTPAPAVRPSTTGLGAARSLEGGAAPQRPAEPPPPKPETVDTSPPDLPDFSLEVPPAGSEGTAPSGPAAAASDFSMDFNLEPLPPIDVPGESRPAESKASAASQAQSNDLEFKLDDLSLDFGTRPPAAAKPARDDHWYDVQQKFDLAKAYEEMGDKDGARDILQEVVKEGDAEQQAQAKKLLSSLA